MHVISREPFDLASIRFPNCAQALTDAYRTLKQNTYQTPEALKKSSQV